jgi:murein L,D-transpeptidase YcbB/YkuD
MKPEGFRNLKKKLEKFGKMKESGFCMVENLELRVLFFSWFSSPRGRMCALCPIPSTVYSKVWFNTPSQTTFARSAPSQIRQCLQKFGIKPDGIIGPKVRNFLSNEPPIKLTQRLRYWQASLLWLAPRRLISIALYIFCIFPLHLCSCRLGLIQVFR